MDKAKNLELVRTEETTPLFRVLKIQAEEVDRENLELGLSFSSEEPVRRFFWEEWEFGTEILDHGEDSVRLGRLSKAGPLLKFHDRTNWLGKVVAAAIDPEDRRGIARVRFHKSEAAEFEDVVSGTKDTVSVGYAVHRMILEQRSEEDGPTYRVVDWEPIEISLEPTPADVTVGPGRVLARSEGDPTFRTEIFAEPEEAPAERKPEERKVQMDEKNTVRETNDLEQARQEAASTAREKELERMDEITKLADQYADKVPKIASIARSAISEGLTKRQFESLIGPILDATPIERFVEDAEGANDVGLTNRETREFSMLRLFAALSFGDREPHFREEAAFELEASEEARKRSPNKKRAGSVVIPPEVLRAPAPGNWIRGAQMAGVQTRDMTAGGATTGADFVQTDVLGGSLIDFLRDLSVLLPRATVLRGLQGNVAIPRVTAGVAGAWVAEGSAPSETTPTLDQMLLSPKTVIAYVDVTRRLLLQSSVDVEAWLRREFGAAFAVTLENAGITDDGGVTTRPEGILGLTGTVQHNPGGAETWAHVVGYEANVQLGAALMGDLAYLTNPKVSSDLKSIVKGGAGSGRFIMEGGQANGYDVLVTNQVPSNLGAGTDESAMIFGNMREAVFGIWDDMAATVDPYSLANAGIIRLTGQMEADFNVRHAEAFSVAEDITTTL